MLVLCTYNQNNTKSMQKKKYIIKLKQVKKYTK